MRLLGCIKPGKTANTFVREGAKCEIYSRTHIISLRRTKETKPVVHLEAHQRSLRSRTVYYYITTSTTGSTINSFDQRLPFPRHWVKEASSEDAHYFCRGIVKQNRRRKGPHGFLFIGGRFTQPHEGREAPALDDIRGSFKVREALPSLLPADRSLRRARSSRPRPVFLPVEKPSKREREEESVREANRNIARH